VQDLWDSIENNEYFSFEGLWDVFKQVIFHSFINLYFPFHTLQIFRDSFFFLHFAQLRFYKTPDIETPNYLILKRTAHYEVLMHHLY